MLELPSEVQQWFLECGWSENHRSELPDFIPKDHPAHTVLATFTGITLLERDCPEDEEPIHEFAFRPLSPDDTVIKPWSKYLKSKLIGIADVHNCHADLYMDQLGRCFSNSLIHDCFAFAGESLADTLMGCLNHRRLRPLLRPGQPSVKIYGEMVKRGDPRIWTPE